MAREMSGQQLIWLLVEKVNCPQGVSAYDVVSINPAKCAGQDIRTGKLMYIQTEQDARPKQVLIKRISGCKKDLKKHQQILESRQSTNKTVVTECVQYAKKRKSSVNPHCSRFSPRRRLVTPESPEDSSSSDEDQKKFHELVQTLATYSSHLKRSEHPKSYRRSLPQPRRRSLVCSTPNPEEPRREIKLTFDQATQTEHSKNTNQSLYQDDTVDFANIETLVKSLYKHFTSLISTLEKEVPVASVNNSSVENSESENSEERTVTPSPDHVLDAIPERVDIVNQNIEEPETEQIISTSQIRVEPGPSKPKPLEVRRVSAHTTNVLDLSRSSDMVPIGNGHAMVPARLLNEIKGRGYTTATRQLLQAVFPRRVLATHSLTGKQSPAFLNKPAKKCLDKNSVDDIVMTVTGLFKGISERLVRNIITIKCTDEAKLFRKRQQRKYGRIPNQNQENIRPSSNTSDTESSY